MDEAIKKEILEKAKDWWRNELATSHAKNTTKLTKVKEFKINPFTWSYLSYFLEGKLDEKTLAKVLVYPRILGTSINTSFGEKTQSFITTVFQGVLGSTTQGIDLEFVDKVDGRKKYAQLKAGPNVINADDVEPIKEKFRSAKRLARTNNLLLNDDDFMLCLIYGEAWQISAHMRKIQKDFPIAIGVDFWVRFTGDPEFYTDLVNAIGEVAKEFDMKDEINQVIEELAKDIKQKYPDLLK
jgi:hypothetical protein